MIYSQLYFLLVVELFVPSLLAAISFPSKYENVTYWLPGSTVTLPWDYDFLESEITSKEWVFVASRSTEKKGLATIGFTSKKDPRVNLTGKATLIFPDAKSSDNGTYTFQLTLTRSRFSSKSVLVIILVAPIAQIHCSGNYADYYCECKSDVGNPPPQASWHKDGNMIGGFGYERKNLTISDISSRGPGTYTCNVTSHNLSNQKNLVLNKPTSISFTSNPTKVTIGGTVRITCTANVNPPPQYVITFNGSKINDVVDGKKHISGVSRKDAGKYKCVARNIFGNETESLDLEVEEKLATTAKPKSTTSTKVTEKSKCESCEIKWYIILITLICGIFIGMVLLYAILSLRQRLKDRKDDSEPPVLHVIPETNRESATDNSAYQELDLRNRDPENDYQALRLNSRKRVDNETKTEDEAGYQELDKVRENNDNYQALNRV